MLCLFCFLQHDASVQHLLSDHGVFCLDGTHGTNDTGHILYTLLLVANSHHGLPVGTFLVPEKHDRCHIEAALRWILLQVPDWKPYAVMADDDSKGM